MSANAATRQFSTFFIGDRLYGIDVMRVQEITRALPMARVPLAPKFVHGLINLRGQISTAIGLRELFEIPDQSPAEQMNVVCKLNDVLVSFLVDRIGDVMELDLKDFETAPETMPEGVRKFVEGVFKTPGTLLSVIDVNKIADFFFKTTVANASSREVSSSTVH
jgi:purine-binding chemotaxis protein CheW